MSDPSASARSNCAAAGGGLRALALGAALICAAGTAQAINRCEGRDGRVTYTDEPCPVTARSARKVDDSAPLQVREAGRPAREQPAGDAQPAGAAAAASEPKKAAALLQKPARVTTATPPDQEIRRIDEQRARQQSLCEQARRRAEFAARDLDAAGSGERASAELALRRVQEEVRALCPPR